MIKVTIFNEFKHEQERENVKAIYPDGIHGTLKEFLESDDVTVRTVVEYDENLELIPNCGITEELLADTDVLISDISSIVGSNWAANAATAILANASLFDLLKNSNFISFFIYVISLTNLF